MITDMLGKPVNGAKIAVTAISGPEDPVPLEAALKLKEGEKGEHAGNLPPNLEPGSYKWVLSDKPCYYGCYQFSGK